MKNRIRNFLTLAVTCLVVTAHAQWDANPNGVDIKPHTYSTELGGAVYKTNRAIFIDADTGGRVTEDTTYPLQHPPQRYFETWYLIHTNLTEATVLQMVTNMVNYGYLQSGYEGILIDEPWLGGHDSAGHPYASTNRFPRGMKYVVDTCKSMGLKRVGVFASLGTHGVSTDPDTGLPVSGHAGFEASDASYMVTNWGINFFHLVVDDRGYGDGVNYARYRKFIRAVKSTGEDVIIQGTMHEYEPFLLNDLGGGRLWVFPNYIDFNGYYSNVLAVLDNWPTYRHLVKPGSYLYYGWNSVGVDNSGSLSLPIMQSQYSVLAMWHSPIGVANVYDGTTSPNWKGPHTNEIVRIVQQDGATSTPELVATNGDVQVWAEDLGYRASQRRAVLVINRSTTTPGSITFGLTNIALQGSFRVCEAWSGSVTTTDTLSVPSLAAYSCRLFLIEPVSLGGSDPVTVKTNLTIVMNSGTLKPSITLSNSADGTAMHLGSAGNSLFTYVQLSPSVPDYTRSAIFGSTNTTRVNVPNSSSGILGFMWGGLFPTGAAYPNGSWYLGDPGTFGTPGAANTVYVPKLSVNGVTFNSGAGSPEGVVTAPVGSIFTRTDGGATTTLYVKTSGAGNTGWTAK